MDISQHINSILNSNTYILSDKENCWLIDIGDTAKIFDFVSNKMNLKGVFLTHSHFDHIYGINELHERFPLCNIYTSDYGKIALKDSKKNLSFYNGYPVDYLNDNVIVLNDEDRINIFDNIYLNVLATPGHCPSCLTYYTDNYIFTGDSYIPGIKVVTNLPKGNKIQSQESVEKIKKLTETRDIYPGHGEIILHQNC